MICFSCATDKLVSQSKKGAKIRFSTSLVTKYGSHEKVANMLLKKEQYKDVCPHGIFNILPGPLMDGGSTSVSVRCKNQIGREYTEWE